MQVATSAMLSLVSILPLPLTVNRPDWRIKKGDTEVNPAYGMSSPHHCKVTPETEEEYVIPHYTKPPSAAPEEDIYESMD